MTFKEIKEGARFTLKGCTYEKDGKRAVMIGGQPCGKVERYIGAAFRLSPWEPVELVQGES